MNGVFPDGDINGDLSGDEQSMASDNGPDHHDNDSMDSDRGALNLVSYYFDISRRSLDKYLTEAF